jgi:4-hydroxy-L-threonine phosphate dehydrogenase PdxA
MGDAAGIGPEITIKALAAAELPKNAAALLSGTATVFACLQQSLAWSLTFLFLIPKQWDRVFLSWISRICRTNSRSGVDAAVTGKASAE